MPKRDRPASIAEYAAELVADAPPPTPEQIALVRGLLGPYLPDRSRFESSRS